MKRQLKTLILPAVLYGCETWSLNLREEYIYIHLFIYLFIECVSEQGAGEMTGFITCMPHQNYKHEKVKKGETGRECCFYGPKRDEVTGEWRKLHSEELHNLY
jgi:hypothetical protein